MAAALCLGLLAPEPARCQPADEQMLADLKDPNQTVLRWGPAQCIPEFEEVLHSLRCFSRNTSEPFFVASHRPAEQPWDLRGRFLKLWIRVEEVRNLGAFELRLSSDNFESNYFAFPMPLFGDLEFNVLQDRTWAAYTFSFSSARIEGKPDRARINAIGWLARDKSTGALDMAVGGLASVRAPKQGALSITFDDGTEDQWQAAEILAEQGLKGTAYVIPNLIGTPGFLDLSQLHAMHDRFGWEIAGHHGTPLTDMTPRQLDRALIGVSRYLEDHGFGSGASHFAYPLGKVDAGDSLRIARKVFATGRMAGAGPETLPPADPHKLRVMNVLDTTPPAEIVARARLAMENGDWLILMLHKLRSPAEHPLHYEPAKLRELAAALRAAGIRSETVEEVWSRRAK